MISQLLLVAASVSASLIVFTKDYKTRVEGALIHGQDIWVDYPSSSRVNCDPSAEDGTVAGWYLAMHYQFNNDPRTQTSDTVAYYLEGPRSVRPVIHYPPKGDLEMWFTCANHSGIVAYDSNYGNNYHFTVL